MLENSVGSKSKRDELHQTITSNQVIPRQINLYRESSTNLSKISLSASKIFKSKRNPTNQSIYKSIDFSGNEISIQEQGPNKEIFIN